MMHVDLGADPMAWQKTGMTTEGGHQLHTSPLWSQCLSCNTATLVRCRIGQIHTSISSSPRLNKSYRDLQAPLVLPAWPGETMAVASHATLLWHSQSRLLWQVMWPLGHSMLPEKTFASFLAWTFSCAAWNFQSCQASINACMLLRYTISNQFKVGIRMQLWQVPLSRSRVSTGIKIDVVSLPEFGISAGLHLNSGFWWKGYGNSGHSPSSVSSVL